MDVFKILTGLGKLSSGKVEPILCSQEYTRYLFLYILGQLLNFSLRATPPQKKPHCFNFHSPNHKWGWISCHCFDIFISLRTIHILHSFLNCVNSIILCLYMLPKLFPQSVTLWCFFVTQKYQLWWCSNLSSFYDLGPWSYLNGLPQKHFSQHNTSSNIINSYIFF